ncbi:MAG: tetratricopeptide repeat protein [Desulfovibrio sp.]|jgi:cytochrome c-type biogenesis protein CcmH/NrfG|nr:tetratricopeptide repeat protein [Desulfovibrio sp.]
MQYSQKDLEFLGRQVSVGLYVRRSTFLLALALTLVLGVCAGRYVLPAGGFSGPEGGQKRPLSADGAAEMGRKKEILQSIFQHEEDARRNPDRAETWEHLGNLYFDAGEPEKAVNAYNKAIELQPGNPNILVDCGVMYREMKRHDKALEYFQKALALDPGHEQALFNSGIVMYFDLNKKDEALKTWRALLRKNPDARTPSGDRLADMLEHLK